MRFAFAGVERWTSVWEWTHTGRDGERTGGWKTRLNVWKMNCAVYFYINASTPIALFEAVLVHYCCSIRDQYAYGMQRSPMAIHLPSSALFKFLYYRKRNWSRSVQLTARRWSARLSPGVSRFWAIEWISLMFVERSGSSLNTFPMSIGRSIIDRFSICWGLGLWGRGDAFSRFYPSPPNAQGHPSHGTRYNGIVSDVGDKYSGSFDDRWLWGLMVYSATPFIYQTTSPPSRRYFSIEKTRLNQLALYTHGWPRPTSCLYSFLQHSNHDG